ncbi:MAG: GYD domain-containing protein [Pseudomonadota bacterium]
MKRRTVADGTRTQSFLDAIKQIVIGAPRDDASVVESLGGTFVSAYMAMGETDFMLVYDAPDDVTAGSLALAQAAGGAADAGAYDGETLPGVAAST